MRRLFAQFTLYCLILSCNQALAARRYIFGCDVVYLDNEPFKNAYQMVFIHPVWNPDFTKAIDAQKLEVVASLGLFGSNYLSSAFMGDRIFLDDAINAEQSKMEDKYFGFLEGFDDQEIKTRIKNLESKIPSGYKTFLGVYDPSDEKLLSMIRTLRVPTENRDKLALSLLLKSLDVDFDAQEILGRFPEVMDKTVILQTGMVWREKSDMGEDAKRIWELFLGGANGSGRNDGLMLALADTPRSVLYGNRYGFQVQYRLFKNSKGKWTLERADQIKRDAPESEKSEYILAASTNTIRNKIMDRVLTDSSYWDLFEKQKGVRDFFEIQFTDGRGMSSMRLAPRYRSYFMRFPEGLGR